MAAHRLSNHGHPFVVIEQNQEVIQTHEKIHFIAGDAHQDAVLHPANIQKAKYLITPLPDDVAIFLWFCLPENSIPNY